MSLCLVSAYVYDPVSVCLRVCVFMYVSLWIYLYSFVSMCLHVSISLCLCVYVLVCVCMSQYMYVCLYVFQNLCFCVFVSRVCMGLYLYISVDPFFPEDNQNPGPHTQSTHIYPLGKAGQVSILANKAHKGL